MPSWGRHGCLPFDVNFFQECVWGVAYKVPDDAKEHLDIREGVGQNMYKPVSTLFYPKDTSIPPFSLDIYIGTSDNSLFLGPAKLEDIAKQIYNSEGPSGKNTEYLFKLASAMKQLAPEVEDKHLYDLEKEVLNLIEN